MAGNLTEQRLDKFQVVLGIPMKFSKSLDGLQLLRLSVSQVWKGFSDCFRTVCAVFNPPKDFSMRVVNLGNPPTQSRSDGPTALNR